MTTDLLYKQTQLFAEDLPDHEAQLGRYTAAGLTSPQAFVLETHAAKIISIGRRAIVEIGRELLAAREVAEHGTWGPFLERCGIEERTARNYMNVAERFGDKPEIISALPPTALYAMAAPSADPALVGEIVEEVRTGAPPPSVQEVKQRLAPSRPASTPPAPPARPATPPPLPAALTPLQPALPPPGGEEEIARAAAPTPPAPALTPLAPAALPPPLVPVAAPAGPDRQALVQASVLEMLTYQLHTEAQVALQRLRQEAQAAGVPIPAASIAAQALRFAAQQLLSSLALKAQAGMLALNATVTDRVADAPEAPPLLTAIVEQTVAGVEARIAHGLVGDELGVLRSCEADLQDLSEQLDDRTYEALAQRIGAARRQIEQAVESEVPA